MIRRGRSKQEARRQSSRNIYHVQSMIASIEAAWSLTVELLLHIERIVVIDAFEEAMTAGSSLSILSFIVKELFELTGR